MKQKHLHRYRKVNIARKGKEPYYVYKCTKIGCNHYARPELIEGMIAECPRCDAAYIITRSDLKNVVLHCVNCTVSREATI